MSIDTLVRGADPWPPERVDALDLAGAEHDLLEHLAATPHGRLKSAATAVTSRYSRWQVALAATATAAIVAVATPVVLDVVRDARPVTYGTTATKVADANQRLLVHLPGWAVSDVSMFTADEGEMTFTDGTDEIQVNWRPAGEFGDHLAGRLRGNSAIPYPVLGEAATMVRYRGSTDFTTILPPGDVNFIEVRGDLGSRAAYTRVLDALIPVSSSEWLAAMPANVVVPSDVDAVAAEMMADMPLPPGFDAAEAVGYDLTGDRYDVGVQVSGAVMCAWLVRWDEGNRTGNVSMVDSAAAAMQTSREWEVLHDMNAQGDYPEVAWEIADGAAGLADEYYDGGFEFWMGAQGLGCDGYEHLME
jgi:hypothetical protein